MITETLAPDALVTAQYQDDNGLRIIRLICWCDREVFASQGYEVDYYNA